MLNVYAYADKVPFVEGTSPPTTSMAIFKANAKALKDASALEING